MPLRSQGHCGFGRGLSGLLWVWCNGRGPHLELGQEPQGSASDFLEPDLTQIAGSLLSLLRSQVSLYHCTTWEAQQKIDFGVFFLIYIHNCDHII